MRVSREDVSGSVTRWLISVIWDVRVVRER